MPNRIIREGILRSTRINKLSPLGELFYRRLMSVVDDYGRTEAHPTLLRSACYPLLIDQVSEGDVNKHLTECESYSLVHIYEVDGKQFLELTNFNQQIRAKHSKYPNPPSDAQHMRSTCVADAQHMQSNAHLGGGGGGGVDEGGGGGGQANQPTNQPPSLNQFIQTFKQWPTAKVQEVYESFVAKGWMWGKNKVTDYNEAFAIRLKDRAAKPIDTAIDKSLQRLGESMGVTEIKPNGRLFVSELKEKKRVLDDRLKEIKYRGFDEPLGFHYANDDDRQKAKLIKQQLREIDEQILET